MQHPEFRTFASLERQMAAARQLRSETVLRGTSAAINALTSLLARILARWHGDQGLSAPSWLLDGSQQRSKR